LHSTINESQIAMTTMYFIYSTVTVQMWIHISDGHDCNLSLIFMKDESIIDCGNLNLTSVPNDIETHVVFL